jgi:hypothetical protein
LLKPASGTFQLVCKLHASSHRPSRLLRCAALSIVQVRMVAAIAHPVQRQLEAAALPCQ